MKNHMRVLIACLGLGIAMPVQANFFNLPFGIEGEYSINLNYAAAMRTQSQDRALIEGELDELQPVMGDDAQSGLVGFERTGLPDAANFDDGNRNFDRGSLIFNRVSALGDMTLDWRNFTVVLGGSVFYDDVYHRRTDNRDAEFLNRLAEDSEPGAFEADDSRRFSDAMKGFNGRRARVLDAYGVVDIPFGNFSFANIRLGQHLVAWGESLFFGGMASAQSRADATKAFVPGVEIKDILLPTPQVSARVSLGFDLTMLGYYKFSFLENDIFPVGDYFSPADIVGPGAEFAYGSINPASGAGCPGLFDLDPLPIDLSDLCELAGPFGDLLDADDFIFVFREADILPPRSGQWGLGFTYRLTTATTLGLHFVRYHNPNPSVVLNTGFARIGEIAGEEITTEIVGQAVPVTYNIKYFDGIRLVSGSFSTTLFGLNIAGELNFRDRQNIDVLTIASGVPTPVPRRARTGQVLISGISAFNPRFYFDDIAIVAEAGYVRVLHIDPLTEEESQDGIEPQGDGDIAFFGRDAAGFEFLVLPTKRNVISGWDLRGLLSYQELTVGNPAQAGSFSALFGKGDRRLSFGASMQFLQNLEIGMSYNMFFGNPKRRVRDSFVRENPFVDRDYVSLNIGYNL